MMFESEASTDSTVAKYAKMGYIQIPIMAVGFVMGCTEANATFNNKATPNGGYSTNLAWRLADTLSNLGLGGINIPSSTLPAGYTSIGGAAKINYMGWMNKGLVAAIIG